MTRYNFGDCLLEFEIPSQFDHSPAIVGIALNSAVPIRNVVPLLKWAETAALNGIKAEIRTSIRRAWPKRRVIKSIYHFSLQAETKPFSNWEVLSNRDVVVSIMGPIQPYSLPNGTGGSILIDNAGLAPPPVGVARYFGLGTLHSSFLECDRYRRRFELRRCNSG